MSYIYVLHTKGLLFTLSGGTHGQTDDYPGGIYNLKCYC